MYKDPALAPDPNRIKRLPGALEEVIVGKRESILRVVGALLADGHVLLEDVPGTGKTTLARALAAALEAGFRRVQFTPDLLPSDLTGVSVYNPRTSEFEFRPGPVFAPILLADELNRATPRTQSALLEAMEERSVTVDGVTRPLPRPFFVIATQNPVEQHGVYDLPEAQLDRFLVRLRLGYVTAAEERAMVEMQRTDHPLARLQPVADGDDLIAAQEEVRATVTVESNVADYIVRIVEATRSHRDVVLGGSPRASLALYRLCQARAWLGGMRFITPDMVKELAPDVLSHRLLLRAQSRLSGVRPEDVAADVLKAVDTPVQRMRG